MTMTIDKIAQAISEEITRLEKQIRFYRSLLNSTRVHAYNANHKRVAKKTAKPAKKKRTMSAAARKRISEAVKKRWAKVHREQKAAK